MKPRLAASIAILALWLAAVDFLATRHEVFRDEVRALSMATGLAHFWQIPEALRNEGHPVLWYLVLRVFRAVLGTPVALKIASIAVAFGAALLLFRFAPFPLWEKALFLFGALPLYEYSVMARNYGIGMLLLFAFAAAWPIRKERPLVPAILLVLLANTSLHACVLAVVLTGFWIWEERGRRAVLLASVLVALGVACAIAKLLEEVYPITGVPLKWLTNLPSPKDAISALWALKQIPPAERMLELQGVRDTDEYDDPNDQEKHQKFNEILLRVASEGKWKTEDTDFFYKAFNKKHNGPKRDAIERSLDWWSRPTELGEGFLSAMQAYYQAFFEEEEKRVAPIIKSGLEMHRDLPPT